MVYFRSSNPPYMDEKFFIAGQPDKMDDKMEYCIALSNMVRIKQRVFNTICDYQSIWFLTACQYVD